MNGLVANGFTDNAMVVVTTKPLIIAINVIILVFIPMITPMKKMMTPMKTTTLITGGGMSENGVRGASAY